MRTGERYEQKENNQMLDPQTRQQLQTKFQQVKPQLKQRFSGVTDQDLDSWANDPEKLITSPGR